MLDRSFQSITPHTEHVAAEGDGSILQAETYQGLVNAVLYYVTQGVEHGVVRLSNYTRDVERDLDAACLEVVQEDPLGAYSVDFITHTYTRVVSYYEVELAITYRRTREQMGSIVNATGSSAIRSELRGALSRFAPERVLRISAFTGDEGYIRQLLEQAYYSVPTYAMGMPEYTVTLYPDSGLRRIVEITLRYGDEAEALRVRATELAERAEGYVAQLAAAEPSSKVEMTFALLRSAVPEPDPAGGKTAYAALVEGRADSEGMALALQLLCDRAEVSSTVVRGTYGEAPRFWNIITVGEGSCHVDPTEAELIFRTDAELEALGFDWPREQYPVCGDLVTETAGVEDGVAMEEGAAVDLEGEAPEISPEPIKTS